MVTAGGPSTVAVRLVGRLDGSSAKTIPVLGNRFLIGREEACQLRPKSQLVSRRHAEIHIEGDEVTIHDLKSRNGTILNGEPVVGPVPLEDGDLILIGPLELTVSIRPPAVELAHESPSDDQVAHWLLADDDARQAGVTYDGLLPGH